MEIFNFALLLVMNMAITITNIIMVVRSIAMTMLELIPAMTLPLIVGEVFELLLEFSVVVETYS